MVAIWLFTKQFHLITKLQNNTDNKIIDSAIPLTTLDWLQSCYRSVKQSRTQNSKNVYNLINSFTSYMLTEKYETDITMF